MEGGIIAPEARGVLAQRHAAGARERGEIDNGCRLAVLARIRDRIRQHHATLGIGIDDLDVFPSVNRDDIARAVGLASRHVFGAGDDPHDVAFEAQLGDRSHRAEHRHPSAFVEHHVLHVLRGFDRDAARIESNGFSHERDRRLLFAAAAIFEHDQPRSARAALAHGDEASESSDAQLPFIEDGGDQLEILRHFQRVRREHLGIKQIAG